MTLFCCKGCEGRDLAIKAHAEMVQILLSRLVKMEQLCAVERSEYKKSVDLLLIKSGAPVGIGQGLSANEKPDTMPNINSEEIFSIFSDRGEKLKPEQGTS
jgi:hypothetical protein